MRTTLDLDDTVLAASRALAKSRGISLGAAVSELARRGLRAASATPEGRVDLSYSPFPVLLGDPDNPVTEELVAQHRDG